MPACVIFKGDLETRVLIYFSRVLKQRNIYNLSGTLRRIRRSLCANASILSQSQDLIEMSRDGDASLMSVGTFRTQQSFCIIDDTSLLPIRNASNTKLKIFTSTFPFRILTDIILLQAPITIVIKIFKLVDIINSVRILLASSKWRASYTSWRMCVFYCDQNFVCRVGRLDYFINLVGRWTYF